MKQKWTIQVMYSAKDPLTNKTMRARTVIQVEADGILKAYKDAEKSLSHIDGLKLGAIIRGHHNAVP